MNRPRPRAKHILHVLPIVLANLGLALTLGACGGKQPPPPAADCPAPEKAADADTEKKSEEFAPPSLDTIPEGPYGDAVRRGQRIITDTQTYAADYAGSAHNCSNCHLYAGQRPGAAPYWAAWGMYPDYRKKTDRIDTMEDRIRGCFEYSMNAQASKAGKAPEAGDPLLADIQAYMRWLATEAPASHELPGRGYATPAKPEGGPSLEAGAEVYASKCAICHGDDGQGMRAEGEALHFPPLWGPEAYNWGAGMHRINTAAGFIQGNMPLGQGGTLTDKEAWDVAAFINSHERPKDPRQVGEVAEADASFHDHDCMYGESAEGGATLGAGATKPAAAV